MSTPNKPLTKTCKTCQVEKALDQFYSRKDSPDGKRYYCKECSKAWTREWKSRNPGRTKEFADNWKKKYPERYAASKLKCKYYRYEMTLEDYALMAEEQSNVCAICCKSQVRALLVDHCHETGKVRGLLCYKCNTALGQLNDDTVIVRKILNYLGDVS